MYIGAYNVRMNASLLLSIKLCDEDGDGDADGTRPPTNVEGISTANVCVLYNYIIPDRHYTI